MTWRIEWTSQAIKDTHHLDRQVRDRIVRAIERLARTGHGDVISLKKPLHGYRLRVGEWRVSFDRDTEAVVITVRRVRHRSKAYNRD